MMRWLRRFFWLGVLTGGGFAAYRMVSGRQAAPLAAPQWPPLPGEPRTTTAPAATANVAANATDTSAETTAKGTVSIRWVAPVDGTCPDGYPLKANNNSRIFHKPGGRFYDRTVAERCYANEEDAIADGYRPAKA